MDAWTANFWNGNKEECKTILNEPGNWEKVPLLFDDKIALGTFVRFKGMIQDNMLHPEAYYSIFKIINSETGELTLGQAKYHSSPLNLQHGEKVEFEGTLMKRKIVACIPIPGLNEWAKDVTNTNQIAEAQLEENANKPILDPGCQNYSKEIFIFVYPEDINIEELQLNKIIEVVGFLDQRTIQENNGVSEEQSSIAKKTHCIHAVQFKILKNLIPDNEEMYTSIWNDASNIHAELKFVLTQALLGDSLAADYLLFYLVSTIYNRQNNLVPGKCSLNIRGIPYGIGKIPYAEHLYSLISYLVVKSEYLPIQIRILKNMTMVPRKCNTSNRLLNGFLQLSDRTHLVLDETKLEQGNLDSERIQNLEVLKNMISKQKIMYDFGYFMLPWETQIPTLTLSIGKSILPCDIDIVLKPDPSCFDVEETINSVHYYLQNQLPLLDKFRKYIAIISTFPFKHNRDILQVIENDYTQMQRACPINDSGYDLDILLMISKLTALCFGKDELDNAIWERVKSLENQRKLRNN